MKLIDFANEMKEEATKRLMDISDGGTCVRKTHTFPIGQAEMITITGGAIEKAAITHLTLTSIKRPDTGEETDAMVYQMEVFPENPHCPMGHFNTEWNTTVPVHCHMNLDLFPAVSNDEDLQTIRHKMDGVADQFGRDREKMREGLDQHYNMDHWLAPLATKVGCKLLQLKEEDFDLFMTAYHTFFDAYLEILRKRKGVRYTEEENRLKLKRNGKWLAYIAFKDRAVKMAQAAGIPSEVLMGLSFPPSAIF